MLKRMKEKAEGCEIISGLTSKKNSAKAEHAGPGAVTMKMKVLETLKLIQDWVLATRPGNLCSIPGTHTVGGEDRLPWVVLRL